MTHNSYFDANNGRVKVQYDIFGWTYREDIEETRCIPDCSIGSASRKNLPIGNGRAGRMYFSVVVADMFATDMAELRREHIRFHYG